MKVWHTLKKFQLDDFESLGDLLEFLKDMESLYDFKYTQLKIVGHGTYETLEGLVEIETPQSVKKEEIAEYEMYLKLKKKFEHIEENKC